jgi:hypothetical protein
VGGIMPELRNAVIEATMLGYEDHGILTAFVTLRYHASGQGFGWYALSGGDYCGRFVAGVLAVAGAEKWEDLKGKPVRALCTWDKVIELRHHLDDGIVFRPWDAEPSR